MQFYIPDAVYMSDDGGEWCARKMKNGFHVLGPYTTDSLGYWPTLKEAKIVIEKRAGTGVWEAGSL